MTAHLLGVLYALFASALYGGADFGGGLASRRLNHYQVLFLFSLVGIVAMAFLALLAGEGMPTGPSIINAMLASTFGSIGLATLYNGLAHGRSCIVAPSSAVVASAMPVIYGILTEGFPKITTLSGFILAAIGIWLTTRADLDEESDTVHNCSGDGLTMGILAGLFFGAFFIFLARIEAGPIFSPLIFGKMAAAAVGLTVIAVKRIPLPNPITNPVALVSGFLDVMANVLYLVSSTLTRTDIAAVLVCTYPAGTVLLSMLFLKEKINRSQAFGVFLCIAAIALIIV